jgi:hypothetical protein
VREPQLSRLLLYNSSSNGGSSGWLNNNFMSLCLLVLLSTLTTINVVGGVSGEFEDLKLKTCWLYHENLLLQKFNDMITQVLKHFIISLLPQKKI